MCVQYFDNILHTANKGNYKQKLLSIIISVELVQQAFVLYVKETSILAKTALVRVGATGSGTINPCAHV